jgi:hypothetical protein
MSQIPKVKDSGGERIIHGREKERVVFDKQKEKVSKDSVSDGCADDYRVADPEFLSDYFHVLSVFLQDRRLWTEQYLYRDKKLYGSDP